MTATNHVIATMSFYEIVGIIKRIILLIIIYIINYTVNLVDIDYVIADSCRFYYFFYDLLIDYDRYILLLLTV